nr:uncharacterized protein CI109_001761 [Kwoniella shandongensis]KAA5529821.1 hypothetical protein CI109_001761 [Kwoniella shandongensis]
MSTLASTPTATSDGSGRNPIGEISLSKLLSTLTLTLHPTTYVFSTIPLSSPLLDTIPLSSASEEILLTFREKEGMTLILSLAKAEEFGLNYQFRSKMITCNVHSSLEAVGFIAVLARELAGQGRGIGCNVISGYYHDHLFVQEGQEQEAMEVLEQVARDAKERGA